MILDGKVFVCDRCKEPAVSAEGEVIDLWYSGKAHAHGGSIQAVPAPDGFPLWLSPVEPGPVHDLTASPGKIGDIARAALVLTHFEHGYIT